MRRLLAVLLFGLLCIDTGLLAEQKTKPSPTRSPRLFEPEDLGLLEPPDREAWQKPDQVMDAVHIAEGTTVADIGAGGGWFTMRLARRVGPNGRVYANDVQRLMIEKAIQVWTFAPDMIDVTQSYVHYAQHFTTNYYGFRTVWLER